MANPNHRRSRKYSDEDLDRLAEKIHEFCDTTDFPLITSALLSCGNFYDGEFADISRRYNHENFSHAYLRLENLQKDFLSKKGLQKDHDSSLTKFFLSACHGMTEKQHIVTETVESCIEADEEECAKAEEFERKRKKVEL